MLCTLNHGLYLFMVIFEFKFMLFERVQNSCVVVQHFSFYGPPFGLNCRYLVVNFLKNSEFIVFIVDYSLQLIYRFSVGITLLDESSEQVLVFCGLIDDGLAKFLNESPDFG